ncbi:MAG TPA: helix-turn-helix transcriptional regulator [Ktedonobacteraceae bacterium]|nr:helix-turn-helix transcriptional regulator [Ktedonobacteraceae bacterium]
MDKSKNSRQQGQSRSLANSQREYAAEMLSQEIRRVPGLVPQTTEENDDTSENTPLATGGTKPFATLLSFLLKNDRSEIQRLAREIGVSDNTIYRWINGTSEPRASHMHRLLEVLPRSYQAQSFPASVPGIAMSARGTPQSSAHWDVPREIYRRVMEQAAITVDDASRRWHIVETIFEYALLHLDPDRKGMALTYARLMPPREDGTIHSLYEAEMRGQSPWPFALDFKAYLGSTTLAGTAAMLQRVYTWSRKDEEARHPIGLDEHEHSSCAAPVMRGGRLAGVLIVSSTQDDLVAHPAIPRAVGEYAHLLAVGMLDSDFYPVSLICLVPMPELKWQRERIANTYLNRVVEYARKQCLSFTEAEQKVLQDLETEFERHASAFEEDLASSPELHNPSLR